MNWPSCPLWPEPGDDDIEAGLTYELADVLSGRLPQTLVLSGEMSSILREQPLSDGVATAEWNLSDEGLLGQVHGLFRGAGAACAVAHTGGCSAEQLRSAGLEGTERIANGHAVSAARACGPRYVMGVVSQESSPLGDGLVESLGLQASILADAGVHGLLVMGNSLSASAAITRSVGELVHLPIVSVVPLEFGDGDDANPITKDGTSAEAAFATLVEAGAFSVGVVARGHVSQRNARELCDAALRNGRGLLAILEPEGELPDGGAEAGFGDEACDAVRAFVDGGAVAFACGRGYSLDATARLASIVGELGEQEGRPLVQ